MEFKSITHWLRSRCNKVTLRQRRGLTCWGGWCPTCQISRQPQGPAAAHKISTWVETSPSSPSYLLLPEIPNHDPRGLNTLCSRIILSSTRRRAPGRGRRRWWNWADSGRDSKSFQVMFGGSQMEGDQKAAEMEVIALLTLIMKRKYISNVSALLLQHCKRKLGMTWIEIEDTLCYLVLSLTHGVSWTNGSCLPDLLSVNLKSNLPVCRLQSCMYHHFSGQSDFPVTCILKQLNKAFLKYLTNTKEWCARHSWGGSPQYCKATIQR